MGVTGLPGQHRLSCGVDDRFRGRKVRFPEAEIDNFTPLRFELLGPLHDFHGEERGDISRAFGKMYGGFAGQWFVLVEQVVRYSLES